MNNPLISIVICTYNRSKYLAQTLKSVLAQHYSPVEILIIDDGSTDNTEQIVRSFGSELTYHRKENGGIASARTAGGKLAGGKYIAYQDDDDLMPPDRITFLYDALQLFPSAVFATGDFVIADEKGNLTEKRWLPENTSGPKTPIIFEDGYEAVMWPRVPASPHTTLFKRADGEKIGWFDGRFAISEDKDFFARLGQLGPLVYVPKVVSYYRRGHHSLTENDILTSYRKLQFFDVHINYVKDKNPKMCDRLQLRILMELKKVARLLSVAKAAPDSIPEGYSEKFLKNLKLIYRIKYWNYMFIRLSLRRLVHKLP